MILADRLAHTSRWRAAPLGEKVFLSGGLAALALGLGSVPVAVLVLLVASLAAWRAGTPMADWGRLLLVPLAFVLTGAVSLLIGLDGAGVHLAMDQAPMAGFLILRSMAAAAAVFLLAVTTPASVVVQGLRRCGLSAELAELALLIYRFLFILLDTASAMQTSQQARLGTVGVRRRLRSLGLLIASLLPRAMDRARRLDVGLAARGFDGALPTLSPDRPVRLSMMAVIAAILLCVGGLGWW